MNRHFSLQRIQWLLRKDWIEHKKSIFYALGAYLLALVPFIWISSRTGHSDMIHKQLFFYGLGLAGSFLYFCKFAGTQVNFPKGLYWTLPAGTEEKYGVLLLEGALFMVSFNLLFWLSIGVWGMIFPDYHMIGWKEIYAPMRSWSFIWLLAALLFYCYIRFRKHAFACWLGGLAATLAVVGSVLYLIVRYAHDWVEMAARFVDTHDWVVSVFRWLATYIHVLWVAGMLGVLYAAYVVFKRKEMR